MKNIITNDRKPTKKIRKYVIAFNRISDGASGVSDGISDVNDHFSGVSNAVSDGLTGTSDA